MRAARKRIAVIQAAYRYHAFVSYTRDADAPLANWLRRRLQSVGSHWWERRQMRVYLDTESGAPGADLIGKIQRDLDRSSCLVLLASEASARSAWVAKEIRHWLRERPASRLYIVLTQGTIAWDEARGDFDWSTSATTALARDALGGVFTTAPAWIDLRDPAGSRAERSAKVAALAADILGLDADGLHGEEIRRHRRAVIGTAMVTAVVTLLSVLAVALSNTAADNGRSARRQAELRTAASLAAAATRNQGRPDVSLLLDAAAYQVAPAAGASLLLEQALRYPGLRRIAQMPAGADTRTVNGIDFSPDGRLLAAAASTDTGPVPRGAVLVWPAAVTGKPLNLTVGGGGAATSVAFSPEGRLLAVGDAAGIVTLLPVRPDDAWPPAVGTAGARLTAPAGAAGGEVERLSFSPDGGRLAASYSDGSALVWDLRNRSRGATLRGRNATFSPDGRTLAAVDATGVVVRDAGTLRETARFARGGVRAIAYSADSRRIAATGDSTTSPAAGPVPTGLVIDDLATGLSTPVPAALAGGVVVFGRSDTVVTDTTTVTQASSPAPHVELTAGLISPGGVAVAPDGRSYARAGHWYDQSLSGAVMLWDAATSASPVSPASPPGTASPTETSGPAARPTVYPPPSAGAAAGPGPAVLSPDRRSVARVAPDGTVELRAAATGAPARPRLDPVLGSPTRLVFSDDGRLLAGINGRELAVWTVSTGSARSVFFPAPGVPAADSRARAPSGLAISPDGRRVAAARPDGLVAVLDLTDLTHRPLAWRPDGAPADLAFAPDGRTLAIAAAGGVQTWDVPSGRSGRRLTVPGGRRAVAIAFTGPGRLAGSDGKAVTEWDLATGRADVLPNPRPPIGNIAHLAAQPAAALLAAAGDDGAVLLFDLAARRRLDATLTAPLPVTGVAFDRAGSALEVSGPVATEWTIDPTHWRDWACDVVQRNLSAQEWRQYTGGGPRPRECARWPLD
jgi:WD40 repeat protein